MMKKGIIAGTALIGIAGGFILAQGALFSSAEAHISAADAKKQALEAFDGTVVEFEFDQNDRTPHYEFNIKNMTQKAEVVVDAVSGAVTIAEVEQLKNNIGEKIEDAAGAVKSDTQIVVKDATNKVTQSSDVVQQAVDTVKAPTTAAIEEKPATAPAKKQLTKAEAINIANTVATGTVVKAELDQDDGRLTYEIELQDGTTEYDVEIDAFTGKVLGFEKDVEDDYDDRDDY